MKRPRDEHGEPVSDPNRPLKVFKTESHVTITRPRPAFKVPSAVGPQVASSSTLIGTGVKESTVFYGNTPRREPNHELKSRTRL
jgi:hypothetical protein